LETLLDGLGELEGLVLGLVLTELEGLGEDDGLEDGEDETEADGLVLGD
jgi:hypothetical protein